MKTIIIDGVEYNLTPKALFKKGDWILYCNEDVDLITGIEDNGYLINEGGYIPLTCQGDMRLWTIQDAKDGDILASNKSIFIFQEEYIGEKPTAYGGLMNGLFIEGNGTCWTNEKCYPAIREQRDLLFQKMHEAGYEWDAEKKELKKIEQKPAESRQETKPNGGIVYEDFNKGDGYYKVNLAYLSKSQVEHIENLVASWQNSTNNTSEWSEEDEEIIEGLNNCLNELEEKNGWRYTYVNNKDIELNKIRKWLKSIRPQPKQEWNEEDEKILEIVTSVLQVNFEPEERFSGYEEYMNVDLINWLKSLKQRMKGE